MICPICGENLKELECSVEVRDGNTVYQCEKNKYHKFWIHPFQNDTIHWYPGASAEKWDSFCCWKIRNENYVEISVRFDEIEKFYKNYLMETKLLTDGIFKLKKELKELKK